MHDFISTEATAIYWLAIIPWAGTPKQKIWLARLSSILEATTGTHLSPVVIIIGEVVRLRQYLKP